GRTTRQGRECGLPRHPGKKRHLSARHLEVSLRTGKNTGKDAQRVLARAPFVVKLASKSGHFRQEFPIGEKREFVCVEQDESREANWAEQGIAAGLIIRWL